MKERPILMCGEMVVATLADLKTETRRIAKVPEKTELVRYDRDRRVFVCASNIGNNCGAAKHEGDIISPYGVVGDRLWVRETWKSLPNGTLLYRASHAERSEAEVMFPSAKWRPSIFMRRAACRLLLEIVAVRIEQLWEITEAGAKAEGVTEKKFVMAVAQNFDGGKDYNIPNSLVGGYCCLWDGLNGKRGYRWALNPWVWVVQFKRITA